MRLLKLCLLITILLASFYGTTRWFRNSYVKRPPVPNFDGRVFLNDAGETLSPLDRLQGLFQRTGATWPDAGIIYPTRIPQKRLPPHKVEVTYVGHATFLLQIGGKNILTNPMWGDRASSVTFMGPKRLTQPGIKIDDLPPIDYVLISDNQYDHMDSETIKQLITRDWPTFITFYGNDALIKKNHPRAHVIPFGWWGETHFDDGEAPLKIIGCPAHHSSSRHFLDRDKALWGGFMIKTPKHRIYFSGGTGYHHGKHFRMIQAKLGRPDIAILPLGSYEPRRIMQPFHMNPDDAVKAHRDLGARLSIGMQFDVFGLGDEAYHQAEADLSIARVLNKVPADDFMALTPGRFVALP